MSHHCHATNCKVEVPPEMWGCRKHWYMVPAWLRRLIWANYRVGQCDDYNPSDAYLKVAKAAVIAVARKEGIEPDTKLYDMFLGL